MSSENDSFMLMRHGDADYGPVRRCIGWGVDLAPLSPLGRRQVEERLDDIAAWRPRQIICSPMTRAFETALIVSQQLKLPLEMCFGLHEWIPKLSFDWKDFPEVEEMVRDLRACGGEWPAGEKRPWEPLSSIRTRARKELERFRGGGRVLVVAHAWFTYALTGVLDMKNAQLVPYAWDGE